jgi:hypothetical protein
MTTRTWPVKTRITRAGPRTAVVDIVRALAVAGVLLSADVHLNLWLEGYRDIDTIGPLFLLNAAGGVVIGVVLLAWRHPLSALAAAGFGAATLTAFWLSATVGLFGLHESAGGVPQLVAEGAEIAALVFGAATAWLTWSSGARRV